MKPYQLITQPLIKVCDSLRGQCHYRTQRLGRLKPSTGSPCAQHRQPNSSCQWRPLRMDSPGEGRTSSRSPSQRPVDMDIGLWRTPQAIAPRSRRPIERCVDGNWRVVRAKFEQHDSVRRKMLLSQILTARYRRVPTIVCAMLLISVVETPKSHSFIWPWLFRSMLEGFTSESQWRFLNGL